MDQTADPERVAEAYCDASDETLAGIEAWRDRYVSSAEPITVDEALEQARNPEAPYDPVRLALAAEVDRLRSHVVRLMDCY